MSAIILSTSAAEGFVNDLVGIVGLMVEGRVGPTTGDVSRLGTIAYTLEAMEEDHCGVRPKYLVAAQMLGATSIQKGAEPFQSFDDLVALRNSILHAKPLSLDTKDRPTKIAARLAARGLAPPP